MKSLFRFLFSIRTVVLLLIVLAVVGGGGYLWWISTAGAAGPSYRTEPVVRKNLDATVTATGTIEPEEVIDVGAQVQGLIVNFGPADPADPSGPVVDYCTPVKKDQVLANIDPRIYQAHLDQAKAALATANAGHASAKAALAKSEASRDALLDAYQRDASSPGAVPTQTVVADKSAYNVAVADVKVQQAAIDQAQANVDQASANLKEAQENVNYCTIKSPVDGVIIDRRVNVGQTVVASLSAPSLFLLAKDLMKLQIWVAVNEADIGNIHYGQDVTFTVDARPGKMYHGKVSQIRYNATMTQNVVTYTVVISATNKLLKSPTTTKLSTRSGDKEATSELELLPYLTANLTFHVDQRENALLAPNGALRWRPQLDQVAPEFRAEYEQSLHKKSAKEQNGDPPASGAADPKSDRPHTAGGPAKSAREHDEGGVSQGTVWVQDGAFVRPITIKTGLTDGVNTEVVEVVKVHDGDALDEGTMLVSGENAGKSAAATTNPFAPPPIFRPQQPKKQEEQK
jgi:HlyD family secretion protein